MAQLGFVGRGIMGKPRAGHLIAAGHAVRRYGRSGAALELTGGHAVAKRVVAA